MKKIVLAALVLALLLTFAGCAEKSGGESPGTVETTASADERKDIVSDASEITADNITNFIVK